MGVIEVKLKKGKNLARALALCLVLGVAGMGTTAMAATYDATNGPDPTYQADMSRGADNFYKSDKVNIQKVSYNNQYGMKIVANLITPKDMKADKKYPAIVVGAPMGAVKEQSATLYATKLAEDGFVTLAFDQSFWGESDGTPRQAVDTNVYDEAFSAAVDYLGTRSFVDRERIGALGICGSGSFSINAAKIDPRIKAIATVSMYDMGTANRWGLKHSQTLEQRKAILEQAAQQRYGEFEGGKTEYTSGTAYVIDENSPAVAKEFFDYYRTPRGYSANTTTQPTLISNVKFMNYYPFNDIETISPRPMLFIAGDQAHSREFSEEAYKLAAEPKELYIVPNAGHVDLYDRTDVIPFDKLDAFFEKSLSK